jgi:hypothetical protein
MISSRRNFAKSLGLAGLLTTGVVAYRETKERIVYKQDELPTADLEKQIESKPVLMMQATYGEVLPPEPYNPYVVVGINIPRYKPGTEKTVQVKLVPGPDGKLYVKENDIWRKV